MMICLEYAFPCFPDCSTESWDDQRKESVCGSAQGHVTHRASGDVYGHEKESDTDLVIRIKLAALTVLHYPLSLLHAIAKIIYILSGHWAWSEGYAEALKEKNVEQLPMDSLQEGIHSCFIVAKHSLFYLADALSKTLTLPVACVLGALSAFLGVFHPLLGRRLFAKVEESWSIHLAKPSEMTIFLNFSAPCMQPKRVREEQHFYEIFKKT